MNVTCKLKEWSELSGALISDADLGDHRNTLNMLSESNPEINQVFEIYFSIAPSSTATQNAQKNDPKVRSYFNDPKTADETDSDQDIAPASDKPAIASTQPDTTTGRENIDAKENQGTQSSGTQNDNFYDDRYESDASFK